MQDTRFRGQRPPSGILHPEPCTLYPKPDARNPSLMRPHARLNRFLPAFYRVRGWDPHTGMPAREKLQELGLEGLAQQN